MDENTSVGLPTGDSRAAEQEWKLCETRFEYAWRYFDFHAKQRTTMFNFFVIFAGFVVNACISLFQKGDWWPLLLVSTAAALATVFFVFLDRRNEEFVHVAEDILRVLEKEVLFKDFKRKIISKRRNWIGRMTRTEEDGTLGIFIREADDETRNRESKYKHGKWLPGIQYIVIGVFVCFVVLSLHRLHAIYLFRQFLSALCRPQ